MRRKLVGQRVRRREDPALLSGQARFTDDINAPGQLFLSILRSPYAHARIKSLDLTEANRRTGVYATLDGAAVKDTIAPLPIMFLFPGTKPTRYRCLAYQKVRYAGEPVAALVAVDRGIAEDARDDVVVDYEPLPPVIDPLEAVKSDAPRLHEDLDSNVFYEHVIESGDVTAALARAPVVVKRTIKSHRYTGAPLEPRCVLASFERNSGMLTVWAATQVPHRLQNVLSRCLGLAESHVRVIVRHMGGSFGTYKYHPEDLITAYCAMLAGRPVKWTADRREIFLGNYHAREQVHDIALAADKNGRLLGLEDVIVADHGAYLPREGAGPSMVTALMLPGPYRIKNVKIHLRCVLTSKTPTGAYRGFGHPEACFAMECMMDVLADQLGVDKAELRRRNFIRPDEFPYRTPTGMTYDSGDYESCLRNGLELIRYKQWKASKARLRRQGQRIGLGLAFYTENTGFGPSPLMQALGIQQAGYESATMKVAEDGKVTVLSSLCPHGQSSETTLSQVIADQLEIPLDHIEFRYGDTAACPPGQGTFASRNSVVGSALMVKACRVLVEKGKQLAAVMLGSELDRIEYRKGGFYSTQLGTHAGWADLARSASRRSEAESGDRRDLEITVEYDPVGLAFPYALHAALVQVDPETGNVRLLQYAVSHDCGTVINPLVVEGEVHGGVAQGIGGTLLEHLAYSHEGQLLASTFTDYAVPTALDIPKIKLCHTETPSPYNPLGVKGMGEGGAIAPAAAITNAVRDALLDFGTEILETPLTPELIRNAIRRS